MIIDRLDHLVLTVADLDATCDFYSRILGMKVVEFNGRWALHFGNQKINLHQSGKEFAPHAQKPAPGSADLCFLMTTPLDQIAAELASAGVPIELGPVEKEGATGKLRSLYLRDPDGNLIELSNSL
jgi:catechol 2,3-dioxygenase-like lactoylglutathione lyase family enzyme